MVPTFRQLVRALVALGLVGVWLGVFVLMGMALIDSESEGISQLVTAYGLFLGIVGSVVVTVVKDFFNDGER